MNKSFSITKLKKDIIAVCRLVHQKGFVAATDGNISARIDTDRYIITPTGINKAFVTEDELVMINKEGKPLAVQIKLHLNF